MNEPLQTTPCRICQHNILPGAQKCITCGSFQNVWRQVFADFNFQSLIALVPIVTLAYAFIVDRLEPKQSKLSIALLSCQAEKVSLFASNAGNRGAIITAASFASGDTPAAPLLINLAPDQKLIDGGETRALELAVDMTANPGGLVPYGSRNNPDCTVTVVVDTVAFGDELTSPQELQCACPL